MYVLAVHCMLFMFRKRVDYYERGNKVSANKTHKYNYGNLVRPFWCHAQIEEKDADFHGTVDD